MLVLEHDVVNISIILIRCHNTKKLINCISLYTNLIVCGINPYFFLTFRKRRRNRDFSETDNGQLRFKDVRRRILDHIDPYETIKKCSSFQPEPQPYLMFRSQSTDAILEANSEQEATNLTTGEKT